MPRALWPASAFGNKLMESELLFIKVAAIALITYPAVRLAMFKQFAYGRRKYLRMSASQQQQQPRLSLQIYGKHFAAYTKHTESERGGGECSHKPCVYITNITRQFMACLNLLSTGIGCVGGCSFKSIFLLKLIRLYNATSICLLLNMIIYLDKVMLIALAVGMDMKAYRQTTKPDWCCCCWSCRSRIYIAPWRMQ